MLHTLVTTLEEIFAEYMSLVTGLMTEGSARILTDVIGSRPAASLDGNVFFATDTEALSVDDGMVWHDYQPGVQACEFVLWAPMQDADQVLAAGTAYQELPIGETWGAAEGMPFDRGLFPAAARFRLKVHARISSVTQFTSAQLYDVGAAAVVAGSEVIGTVGNHHWLRSTVPFDIAAGVRKLRLQCKRNAGAADVHIAIGLIEVNL